MSPALLLRPVGLRLTVREAAKASGDAAVAGTTTSPFDDLVTAILGACYLGGALTDAWAVNAPATTRTAVPGRRSSSRRSDRAPPVDGAPLSAIF